jgi:uncharacterized phiE125 gp8 family phage protein
MISGLRPYQSLVRTVAPAELPLTVAECKAHLRITGATEDDVVAAMLAAAVAYTDGQGTLGKAIVTQTWRQYAGQSPGIIALQMRPVQSVAAIGYFDTDGNAQAATLSEFDVFGPADAMTVEPKPGKSWPSAQDRPDAIWVDYVAGYGAADDVPSTIKHALKMLVAHYYEARDNATERALVTVPHGYDALIGAERGAWYG